MSREAIVKGGHSKQHPAQLAFNGSHPVAASRDSSPEALEPANALVNRDLCAACKLGGTLLLCDRCPRSYHWECTQRMTSKGGSATLESTEVPEKQKRKRGRPKKQREIEEPVAPKLKKLGRSLPMADEEDDVFAFVPSNVTPKSKEATVVEEDEGEWICPKCADPHFSECVTAAARLFILKTGEEVQPHGTGISLGRLMQHLEFTITSPEVFAQTVQLAVKYLKPAVPGASSTIPLQMVMFMRNLAAILGRDKVKAALKACEAGAVIAHGLGTMGGDAPCYNPKCEAFEKFRVLRTHCLFCGSAALHPKTRLPLMGLDRFRDEFGQIRPKLWTGEKLEAERIAVAQRGLVYFYEVANEPKMLAKGHCGDVMFLAYKLWGALRGSPLEDPARQIIESLCQSFLESHKGTDNALTEDADMAEILDTSEALHVLTRIIERTKTDPKQPRLKMKLAAVQIVVDTLLSIVEQKLLEYDLTDVTGFDPRSSKSPQTPQNHCSNCGKEYPKGSKKLVCDECKHTMSTKFDYGSMTDTTVWSFVYQSMHSDITCHSHGGKRGTLLLRDFIRFLPEARKYKDLDELGEDFWKLQSYFVTHFIYVMSDWGERQLRRELYLEEFRFLTASLNHAINHNDPELVGEFIHCLCILGYRLDDDLTNQAIQGLKRSFLDALRFLIASEESFDKCGRWTHKNSVAYARYHATWCGIVGLVPHRRISQSPPVSFIAPLDEPEPRFGNLA